MFQFFSSFSTQSFSLLHLVLSCSGLLHLFWPDHLLILLLSCREIKLTHYNKEFPLSHQTNSELNFTTLPQRHSKALTLLSQSFWNGPVMYAQHKQNTEVLINTPSLQATVRSPRICWHRRLMLLKVIAFQHTVFLENNKKSWRQKETLLEDVAKKSFSSLGVWRNLYDLVSFLSKEY